MDAANGKYRSPQREAMRWSLDPVRVAWIGSTGCRSYLAKYRRPMALSLISTVFISCACGCKRRVWKSPTSSPNAVMVRAREFARSGRSPRQDIRPESSTRGWQILSAATACRRWFLLHWRREFLAGEVGHHGCAPGVLLSGRQITRSLFDPLVLGTRVAVAGLVALMGQARFGLSVPTRHGLPFLGCVTLGFGGSCRDFGHQIRPEVSGASAATPCNHAMEYLLMMFLLALGAMTDG